MTKSKVGDKEIKEMEEALRDCIDFFANEPKLANLFLPGVLLTSVVIFMEEASLSMTDESEAIFRDVLANAGTDPDMTRSILEGLAVIDKEFRSGT